MSLVAQALAVAGRNTRRLEEDTVGDDGAAWSPSLVGMVPEAAKYVVAAVAVVVAVRAVESALSPCFASSELVAQRLGSVSEGQEQGRANDVRETRNRKRLYTRRTYIFPVLHKLSLDGRIPMIFDIIVRPPRKLL